MADGTEGADDLEAPEEEIEDGDAALLYFGKYRDERRALPWEQWTTREKANYYLDRLFLGFLAVALLLLVGEFGFKMWYVTNVKKIAETVMALVTFVIDWLFAQERHEELAEL